MPETTGFKEGEGEEGEEENEELALSFIILLPREWNGGREAMRAIGEGEGGGVCAARRNGSAQADTSNAIWQDAKQRTTSP